jgi:hypothetical protein
MQGDSAMLYAAFVFWALVAIFAARAVYNLLGRVMPPKVLNYALLPGTLVAQIGHHLALLVTGGTISQSRLANDSTGEPEIQSDAKPRIPVLGPVLVAVVPIFLCGLALVLAADWLSTKPLMQEAGARLPRALPKALPAFWDQAQTIVNSLERASAMWRDANWNVWRTWLFAYLTVCLTIRMSPLSADLRPALLGVVMFGVIAWLIGTFTTQLDSKLLQFWPKLSFLVANLLLILLIALAAAGCLGIWGIVKGKSGPAGAAGTGGGKSGGKPAAKPA